MLTAAAEARDTHAKHLAMFTRRASRGQCFHRPYLGIRDRFYGGASTTPATVFPLLARKCAHHITSLRRREKSRGLAHWYEREIDTILDGVGTAFPRSLGLEDQGRFALGYHHQRTWKRDSGQAADLAADDSGAEEG